MIYSINYIEQIEKFDNLEVTILKKLTLIERKIISFLFTYPESQGEKENLVTIPTATLEKALELEYDKINYYLYKISMKKIEYNIEYKKITYKGIIGIIDSYLLGKDKTSIRLSKELAMSLVHNNFFSSIDLKAFLFFENSYSQIIFSKLLNSLNPSGEGYLEFSLEYFKKILDIGENYDRFYDLERKVINSIIDDINKYSSYQITLLKEKKSTSKTSKVINIKFNYINRQIKELKNQTNFILSISKNSIEDFSVAYSIILENIKIYGYDHVYKTINFIIGKFKKEKIDKFLQKAFTEKWLEKHILDTANNKITLEKQINSGNNLYSEIVEVFKKMKIEFLTEDANFNSSFYRNLFALKNGNIHRLKYETSHFFINIEVLFFENQKSQIKIEKTPK